MKKLIKVLFLVILGFMIYSNQVKKEQVVYLPFDLPGDLMATTIPPFGIFIEEKFKNEGDGKGSLLAHELIHWKQYQKMGFFNFYYEYLSEYIKHGRVNDHWMEVEARKLSN
jgi:hypothetical protein